jgi:hypothetical protein
VVGIQRRLATQRIANPTAGAKRASPNSKELLAACIPKSFPPDPLTVRSIDQQFERPRLFASERGQSWLTSPLGSVLIALSIFQSVAVGAMFWWTLIKEPRTTPMMAEELSVGTPVPQNNVRATKDAKIQPVALPATELKAYAGEDILFPITLDGTDGVPARSSIVIEGLPEGALLSLGRAFGDGTWTLKPDEIGDLHLIVPATAVGEFTLSIKLVSPYDEVIAETGMVLRVTGTDVGSISQSLIPQREDSNANVGVEHSRDLEDARKPAISSSDTDDPYSTSMVLRTFINLREGPSSSARVIGVIAKGEKVRVLGGKRQWVRVVNPTTSEVGWIYAAGAEVRHRMGHRIRRVAGSTSPSATDDSFWSRVGNWLTSH